jgi:hypothetical protein
MAKAKVQPKPLAQLEAALSKTSNDELLAFGLAILEEGAERADNYMSLLGDDPVPRDALNEGYVFVTQLEVLFAKWWMSSGNSPRSEEAKRTLADVKDVLAASWERS